MSSPALHLQTLFFIDADGRISGTREPGQRPGPLFSLIRGKTCNAWAVRADVSPDIAEEINYFAQEEPTVSDFRTVPVHAERYKSLLEGRPDSGTAFMFPNSIARADGTVLLKDIQLLERNFHGWNESEISERKPIFGSVEEGYAVSICFCARRSKTAAEAGLETAVEFRGRGLGPRVTAAWALAIRASGRTPLYSTSWCNRASLAVARKLRLVAYASTWSIS